MQGNANHETDIGLIDWLLLYQADTLAHDGDALPFVNGRCISRQLSDPWDIKPRFWPSSARRHEGESRCFPGFSN